MGQGFAFSPAPFAIQVLADPVPRCPEEVNDMHARNSIAVAAARDLFPRGLRLNFDAVPDGAVKGVDGSPGPAVGVRFNRRTRDAQVAAQVKLNAAMELAPLLRSERRTVLPCGMATLHSASAMSSHPRPNMAAGLERRHSPYFCCRQSLRAIVTPAGTSTLTRRNPQRADCAAMPQKGKV